MKTKLVVEVVTPIDTTKTFRNRYNSANVDPDAEVSVSVKIGEKYGTVKIERRYEWKKAKPAYDLDFSPNLQKMVEAAEELKTVKIDDSALIAEYERARAIIKAEYDIQLARQKMDKWLNHPVRLFQAYATQNTNYPFVLNPKFTQDAFMKDSIGSSEESTTLECNYGSRKWYYKVSWDSYRTDNTGKAGKLKLRAQNAYTDPKTGKQDDSADESKFERTPKYSKKVGEIIRYMEEDIERVKSRLDEKIKEEAKELARIAQINNQWKVEGGVIEDVEDGAFSVVMEKKKDPKHSWNTIGKKVDISMKDKHYEIGSIEAKFTKEQVEAILDIVKQAKVTSY